MTEHTCTHVGLETKTTNDFWLLNRRALFSALEPLFVEGMNESINYPMANLRCRTRPGYFFNLFALF